VHLISLRKRKDEEKFVLEWYGITEEKEIRRKAMLAEREKAIRAADDIARNELGDLYELAKMADTVTVACLMKTWLSKNDWTQRSINASNDCYP
jgi:hypothetical protein